jgi:hypothetical protein
LIDSLDGGAGGGVSESPEAVCGGNQSINESVNQSILTFPYQLPVRSSV